MALIADVRDPRRLRRYLRAIAASTSGEPSTETLIDASEINRITADRYDALLKRLFVCERVAPWSPNRLLHLRVDGGRHVVDQIIERSDGLIVGIEVKAATTVDLITLRADVQVISGLATCNPWRAAASHSVESADVMTDAFTNSAAARWTASYPRRASRSARSAAWCSSASVTSTA